MTARAKIAFRSEDIRCRDRVECIPFARYEVLCSRSDEQTVPHSIRPTYESGVIVGTRGQCTLFCGYVYVDDFDGTIYEMSLSTAGEYAEH